MKFRRSTLFFEVEDFLNKTGKYKIYWDHEYEIAWTKIERSKVGIGDSSSNYMPHIIRPKNFEQFLYILVRKYMLRVKWKFVKRFLKDGSKEKRLLDIGAGIGSFADYVRKRNVEVDVVEASKDGRDICLSKNHRVYRNINRIPKNVCYDVITLWHVFEHMPDPEGVLRQIQGRLRRGGILVIALPNLASYDAYRYGECWAAFDAPRHLWHFTPRGLKKMVEEASLKWVSMSTLIYDSYYICYLSEKYAGSKIPWILGLYHGLRSNMSGEKTGNYSTQLMIFKKI